MFSCQTQPHLPEPLKLAPHLQFTIKRITLIRSRRFASQPPLQNPCRLTPWPKRRHANIFRRPKLRVASNLNLALKHSSIPQGRVAQISRGMGANANFHRTAKASGSRTGLPGSRNCEFGTRTVLSPVQVCNPEQAQNGLDAAQVLNFT